MYSIDGDNFGFDTMDEAVEELVCTGWYTVNDEAYIWENQDSLIEHKIKFTDEDGSFELLS